MKDGWASSGTLAHVHLFHGGFSICKRRYPMSSTAILDTDQRHGLEPAHYGIGRCLGCWKRITARTRERAPGVPRASRAR